MDNSIYLICILHCVSPPKVRFPFVTLYLIAFTFIYLPDPFPFGEWVFFLKCTLSIAENPPKAGLGRVYLVTPAFGAPCDLSHLPLQPCHSRPFFPHGSRCQAPPPHPRPPPPQHAAAPRESRLQPKAFPRAGLPVQTPVLLSLLMNSCHSLDQSLNPVTISQGNLFFDSIYSSL